MALDLDGGLIRGGNDEFVWDAIFRYTLGGSLGVGGIQDRDGVASLEFVVTGAGDGQTSLVGAAVLEIVVDGRIEAVLDGAGLADLDFDAAGVIEIMQTGSASMEFNATGVGAYSRIAPRVIIGTPLRRLSSATLVGKASQTRNRVPRSHTEVTNG